MHVVRAMGRLMPGFTLSGQMSLEVRLFLLSYGTISSRSICAWYFGVMMLYLMHTQVRRVGQNVIVILLNGDCDEGQKSKAEWGV